MRNRTEIFLSRHNKVKSNLNRVMTEDQIKELFPRSWLRKIRSNFIRPVDNRGSYTLNAEPTLIEDKTIYFVLNNPHRSTSHISTLLEREVDLTYNSLMSLRSSLGVFEYQSGLWSISEDFDPSCLFFYNPPSQEDLSTVLQEDLSTALSSLTAYLQDVLNAKDLYNSVEVDYTNAKDALSQKKTALKANLEEHGLI